MGHERDPWALIRNDERDVVRTVASLVDCNPFLPERMELERRALGDAFVPVTEVWHAEDEVTGVNPNTTRLRALIEPLGTELRRRLAAGAHASAAELADYHALVVYLLWLRYEDDWWALIEASPTRPKRVSWYARFARDVHRFLSVLPDAPIDAAHLFALGFQARRAFHHTFRKIFGGSLPAAQLRAAVWQSIFTDDVRGYREQLYTRMHDIPTLITGESGTGKELVARAIALSRYVPFNANTHTFAGDSLAGFFAVNLSALSPTLIESELFGHRRGAFTGAVQDRSGWFETCGPYGAVFLDEIGDLDSAIQVKLLRVLQSREFQRIGETTSRRFAGKLIAATHRDLQHEMQTGRFRADLYYRICADLICTPPLREQLADAPDDLGNLVRIAASRIAGAEIAERLARRAEDWVCTHLGRNYAWPGNMRELEQCVRNILIRGEYTRPAPRAGGPGAEGPKAGDASLGGARTDHPETNGTDQLIVGLRDGTLTADELLQGYCARMHAQTGSYQETADRLGLNWRTVRTKVQAWTKRTHTGAKG